MIFVTFCDFSPLTQRGNPTRQPNEATQLLNLPRQPNEATQQIGGKC